MFVQLVGATCTTVLIRTHMLEYYYHAVLLLYEYFYNSVRPYERRAAPVKLCVSRKRDRPIKTYSADVLDCLRLHVQRSMKLELHGVAAPLRAYPHVLQTRLQFV